MIKLYSRSSVNGRCAVVSLTGHDATLKPSCRDQMQTTFEWLILPIGLLRIRRREQKAKPLLWSSGVERPICFTPITIDEVCEICEGINQVWRPVLCICSAEATFYDFLAAVGFVSVDKGQESLTAYSIYIFVKGLVGCWRQRSDTEIEE